MSAPNIPRRGSKRSSERNRFPQERRFRAAKTLARQPDVLRLARGVSEESQKSAGWRINSRKNRGVLVDTVSLASHIPHSIEYQDLQRIKTELDHSRGRD